MIKIEFEGGDGAGKTTGLKYFIEQAKLRDFTVAETREVGNPHVPSCVKMREFVLSPDSGLSGESMELIFSAMRIESDLWLKQQAALPTPPDFVISDRGYFSHLAYGLHNTSADFVQGLFKNFISKVTKLPDIVIYFSVNPETALQRRIKRGEAMDVIELKGVEYQEKVRKTFKDELNEAGCFEQVSVFEVDANQTIKNVQQSLDNILNILCVGSDK